MRRTWSRERQCSTRRTARRRFCRRPWRASATRASTARRCQCRRAAEADVAGDCWQWRPSTDCSGESTASSRVDCSASPGPRRHRRAAAAAGPAHWGSTDCPGRSRGTWLPPTTSRGSWRRRRPLKDWWWLAQLTTSATRGVTADELCDAQCLSPSVCLSVCVSVCVCVCVCVCDEICDGDVERRVELTTELACRSLCAGRCWWQWRPSPVPRTPSTSWGWTGFLTTPTYHSPTERTSSHPRKIIDADCTDSSVLNSGVTEPNRTKFLQGLQICLPITLLKSKLRSSNPFRKANMTYEDRPKIAGAWRQKLHVLTA